MKTIKVTENNGGGITLYAVDAYGNQYAHAGYEYCPENLLEDIMLILVDDEDTSYWDNNDLTDHYTIKDIRGDEDDTPLTIREYFDDHPTTKVIVEGDKDTLVIHYTRLGNAGWRCIFR